jgi:chromosome segregation protein
VRIKSLELNGFKSFVDRTRLEFRPGITGVVGPNGCGKSNVVDAMRWAMGEQSPRRLRGKGMDDVIFAGSEGRAPIGMAEVVMTFDNSDGDGPPAYASFGEIQISRRLYRTGESEYLINKTPCRLRDVQDFFRDTGIGTKGYTIVEQGRIAEIVSAKPEERRSLIEEAAGIGKYKARRREAESKIASTEQNLLRVNDVLGEIRRQIGSIERQARKAARYKRLRETLRVLELSLAADDRRDLAAAALETRRQLGELQGDVTGLETRVADRELGVQRKRLELAECERVLTQGTEALLALRSDIKECEGRIEFGRRERETLAYTISARESELADLRQQAEARTAELADLEQELSQVEALVATGRDALARAEGEVEQNAEALRQAESEREAASGVLVEALTRIARAEDRLAAIDDRRAAIDQRMRSADEGFEVGQSEAQRADREQASLEEGLRNLLAERDRLMLKLREALEAHEQAVSAAREAADHLRAAREERETRRARLESLREVTLRGEDVGDGTRHLIGMDEAARGRLGLRGLVRDAFEVDRDVERAVEAVLADRAEALVVERPEGAVAALEELRSARAGRALLLALPAPEPDALGFVPLGTPVLERVRPRPGFEELARRLLGGVNLVDDLRQVLDVYGAGRIPATFVTRSGDLLSPDGMVRGGAGEGAGDGLIARAREVRELEHEVEALDADVRSRSLAHREAEAALARAGDELENLRNRHHTAALAVANHEKDLERTRERVKALGQVQEGRAAERSEFLAELESLAAERERLAAELEAARDERAERQRELEALGLRVGSQRREVTRLERAAAEARVEHAGRSERYQRLQAGVERARSALGETGEWTARREQEIADAGRRREELAEGIGEAETRLAAALREEEAARSSHDAKRDAYERVSAEVNELEEELRALRGDVVARRDAVSRAELAHREAEMKLSHLDESVREKWDVELATWTPPVVEEDGEGPAQPALAGEAAEASEDGEDSEASPDAARDARANAELARLPREQRRSHLEDVRRKLQALGEVNLGAIEEHEELKERFRFLSEQKADLDQTLESLRDAITRINRTSRRRFRETFEMVAKRFSENFPRLFRGGKASLSLTEAEDVLEAGIEITAQPPGKRLQNVNLLSGGEKTLTAIALLVSVFQVRPSPFFLLDEVDAALDDANVGRFNEIVREMALDSQFVLITHNKRTIEVADLLYGVTMERKGVSKLVSVELH